MSEKKSPSNLPFNLAPAIGSPLRNWTLNVLKYGPPDPAHYQRVFLVGLISAIGVPFRMYENLRLRSTIKKTKIDRAPVFIIGHWRSGTTLILNLLSRDPQFGFITLNQALFPQSFMKVGVFRWFLRSLMPETRPMDNMLLDPTQGEEDELALSNVSRYSLYNGWQFPRHLMEFYEKWVAFKGISEAEKINWENAYRDLLKRATINMDGRRLLLKNPPNTARISTLLKMFPNARFIHIYRNPYVVYTSTRNLYQKAIPAFITQNYAPEVMERDFMEIYRRMMKRYFKDRSLIPSGQLIEMRFEDLEKNPMQEVARVYSQLGLHGFDGAGPAIKTYLDGLGGYRKNVYKLDEQTKAKIEKHWGFAIEKLGYEKPA